MSFVTVFTVSTMAFVLAVPALMILALTAVSPLRRTVAARVQDARDAFNEQDRQESPERRKLYVAA